MSFAIQLRGLRVLRGMSQQDLAEATGIPANLISHMETGKVIPAGDWEVRIKLALQWPTDEAFAAIGSNGIAQPAPQPVTS